MLTGGRRKEDLMKVYKCLAIVSLVVTIQVVPIGAQIINDGESTKSQQSKPAVKGVEKPIVRVDNSSVDTLKRDKGESSEIKENRSSTGINETIEGLISQQFKDADTNDDGSLALDEFRKIRAFGSSTYSRTGGSDTASHKDSTYDAQGSAKSADKSPQHDSDDTLETRFKELDNNSDQRLSKEEFSEALQRIIEDMGINAEAPRTSKRQRSIPRSPPVPERIVVPPSTP